MQVGTFRRLAFAIHPIPGNNINHNTDKPHAKKEVKGCPDYHCSLHDGLHEVYEKECSGPEGFAGLVLRVVLGLVVIVETDSQEEGKEDSENSDLS